MFCAICGKHMKLGEWKISTKSHFGLGPHPTIYYCAICAKEYEDHFIGSQLVSVVRNK